MCIPPAIYGRSISHLATESEMHVSTLSNIASVHVHMHAEEIMRYNETQLCNTSHIYFRVHHPLQRLISHGTTSTGPRTGRIQVCTRPGVDEV